jgi:3-dehydroquinate synthase
LIDILEYLASHQFTRSDLIVALGGGVTGDMAGFAAATYMRGIPFIQIPTTLLAAIDSSVGGKTAVNLNAGKNLAGAFNQPNLVICDYETLFSLNEEEFSAGIAEAVKYGVLTDEKLFHILKSPDVKDHLEWIIKRCVMIKRDLVMADEFDTGSRQFLNLGHTLAHAIEKQSQYTISHGHAVAIGLVVIARAAYHYGLTDIDCSETIKEALQLYHLETECPYPIHDLCQIILNDKKRTGMTITLVIPKKIGECILYKMPIEEIENFFSKGV